jgi:HEAT repeat protein
VVGTTEEICDPKRCSVEDAIRVARQRASEDHSYDLQIAQFVNSLFLANTVDIRALDRGLEILGAIASPGRLASVLRNALAQADPEIRSKAAVALTRHAESTAMAEKLAIDPDPRVRANAIEALWGRKTAAVEVILKRALEDRNHRVVANAAYGLYLIDPAKYSVALEVLLEHSKASYRIAAAWMVRKIGDPKNLGLLKNLVRDKDPDVRKAAFRTLGMLRGLGATAGAL